MIFRLVLLYLVVFYTQIGDRVPVLGTFRIELVLGGLILVLLLLQAQTGGGAPVLSSRLDAPIICLFAVMLISIPTSYWPGRSVETLIRTLKFFAIYIMIVGTVNTERRLRTFVWVYLGCAFFISGEAFWGVLTGEGRFDTHRGYAKLMGETGLWAHPNSLGGFSAANLAFVYFLFLAERSFLKRAALLLMASAFIGTIIYTGSRTAYVGVLGVGAATWIWKGQKVRNLIALSLLIVSVWAVMPNVYRDQFLTLKHVEDVILGRDGMRDSLVARWEIINDAYTIFLDRPITGVGVDAFVTARGRQFDRWQDTHNLYLQILTNIGVVGALAFVWFIARVFGNIRDVLAALRRSGSDKGILRYMADGVAVFLIARLTIGMFGMDLYENYWWLASALSVVIWRLATAKGDSPADSLLYPDHQIPSFYDDHRRSIPTSSIVSKGSV